MEKHWGITFFMVVLDEIEKNYVKEKNRVRNNKLSNKTKKIKSENKIALTLSRNQI